MRLYLARHGDAESPLTHPDRPLSDYGRRQVEGLGSLLKAQDVRVEQVYHSGILRARQTAEHLSVAMQADYVDQMQGLHPNDSVDGVGHMIKAFGASTLLVGHLPFMAKLASWLVLGHTQRDVVIFDTATMACMMYVGGDHWAVEWVLHASLFR